MVCNTLYYDVFFSFFNVKQHIYRYGMRPVQGLMTGQQFAMTRNGMRERGDAVKAQGLDLNRASVHETPTQPTELLGLLFESKNIKISLLDQVMLEYSEKKTS